MTDVELPRQTKLEIAAATLMSRARKARNDRRDFFEFAWTDRKGQPVKLAQFHRQWLDGLEKHRKAYIEGPRGHAKCQPGNARVLLADGRLERLDKIRPKDDVVAFDAVKGDFVRAAARRTSNGVAATCIFQFAYGRNLEVTGEHPLLSFQGWRPAASIGVGDWVAMPAALPGLGASKLPDGIPWLLGLLIGDGSLLSATPTVTIGDSRVLAHLHRVAYAHGWSIHKAIDGRGCATYRITKRSGRKGPRDKSPGRALKQYGLAFVRSTEKRVPSGVFTSTDRCIAEFLAGYFDADGTVNPLRDGSASFSSASRELLRDVQHLLLRLGIQSSLSKSRGRYRGRPYVSWRLSVTGATNLRSFRSLVCPLGRKRKALRELALSAPYAGDELIPPEWRVELRSAPGALRRLHGVYLDGGARTHTRAKAVKAAIADRNLVLLAKLLAPFRWVRVKRVSRGSPKMTYALEVPEFDNYITEDVLTHNTTIISTAMPVFELGRDPNIRVKLIAQNDARAKERLFEIRQHLANNPMIRIVFPDLKLNPAAEESKSKLTVFRPSRSRDASIEAIGVMSAATGSRADLLIFDDVVDIKNSILQPQLREAVKQKVLGEWIPTLESDGRIWVINTPWSVTDVCAYLKALPQFGVVSTPVGTAEDPFAPIWPEHWPREALIERYQILGPVEYDRAYRCIALSTEAVPIQPGWIKYYDAEMLGDPWTLYGLQSYDLALSITKRADFFAGVTLLYDEKRNLIFVVDAWHARLGLKDQADAVVSSASEWQPSRIVVEKGGYQGAFAQYLSERAKVPLPIWTHLPRGAKARRLLDISPLLEEGRVLFKPDLDPQRNPSIAQRGDLISELLHFPMGAHDDMVDALVQGIIALREIFPSGSRETDDGFETGDGVQVRVTLI